jgi:hypothetical protein
MNKEDVKYLIHEVENDGLHYAIADKSNWEQIKDKEFHKLREQYITAAVAMQDKIDSLAEEFEIQFEPEF